MQRSPRDIRLEYGCQTSERLWILFIRYSCRAKCSACREDHANADRHSRPAGSQNLQSWCDAE